MKVCGFKTNKICDKKCAYYETCTRNPYKEWIEVRNGVIKEKKENEK